MTMLPDLSALRPPSSSDSRRDRLLGYGVAIALAALGWAVRMALDGVFGATHTYTVFYPLVILAAYFLGPRPAAVAAAISTGLGYWCFAWPVFAWKSDVSSLTSAVFFIFTSAVSIYFITGMGRALVDLAESRSRAEDLARSHTELFRELNERVTNHLQLVAALLQLQARDERDVNVARALAEASARTLLISRTHRGLSGDAHLTLDFDAFARQLLDATLAARGHGAVSARVEDHGARLPLDQATSVALVMLECLNARLQRAEPGALEVRLSGDEREAVLEVREAGGRAAADISGTLRRDMIEAMVEQLGGRFSFRADAQGAVSELVFPRAAGAPPRSRLLH
jgi:two-component sensor histidine kinase